MNFKLKLIAFFAAMIAFFPLFSQEYKVYSLEGKVEKRTPSGWQILGKGAGLSSQDIIKIGPVSTLRIVDKEKRQIYTFSRKGVSSLLSMVNKAKEENSTLTGKMIAESKRMASAEKSHKSLGAAKRETDDENLEAIYSFLVDRLNAGESSGDLIVEKVELEDGLVYLRFINNAEEDLYANILIKEDETQNWRALFDPEEDLAGLYINAGATMEFPHIILADDGSKMAAIGFTLDFDIEELEGLLENCLAPLEIEAKDVSVYLVK